jgi:chromosome segregation ATPase
MNDESATKQDIKEFRDEVTQQISDLAELVTAGFDTVNARFDRLEAKLDKVELLALDLKKRMRELEVKLEGLGSRFGEVRLGLSILEREHRKTNDWLVAVDGRLEAASNDIKEIYGFIDEIRLTFTAQLKEKPKQEKRLRRLETFAESAARTIGLKLS